MLVLYPTETVYGLGVNALDSTELKNLYELKGRDAKKAVSWLVRDIHDIRRYAFVSEKAAKIAERFLPGPLTLVLPALPHVPKEVISEEDTIAFRISSDTFAQNLIKEYMGEHDAPLTCTSANVSGEPTLASPQEILSQFGDRASMITVVIDDGPRIGNPSTIVRVDDEIVIVLREGNVSKNTILNL